MVTTNQIRDEYRLEATAVGVDAAVAAAQKLAGATEAVATATENQGRRTLSVQNALERFARTNDNLFKMQQTVERGQQLINRAFEQGLAGTSAYDRAVAGLTARQNQLAQAADRATAAVRQAAQENAAASSKLGSLSYRGGSFLDDREITAQRAALLPLVAAEQQYEAQVLKLNQAVKAGVITEKERTALVGTARARLLDQTNEVRKSEEAHARLTKGVGLNAYAWQNLSYQVNDVVTSLASGISPFQTLAQQGGQIYQILQGGQGGVAGALAAIKDRVVQLAGSYGLLTAGLSGLVAIGYATARYADQQHELEKSTLGVGRSAGLTAAQIAKIAEASADAGRVSIAVAKEIASGYVETGKVSADNLGGLITITKDYAAATHQDVIPAAQQLAKDITSLADGGLDRLSESTRAVDANSYNMARRFLDAGDKAQAMSTIIAALDKNLADSAKRAENYGGIFERAWRAVSNAVTNAGQAVKDTYVNTPPDLIKQQISRRESMGLPTGDLKKELADAEAALAEFNRKAVESGANAKRIAEATSQTAVKAVLPEIASLEKINQLRDDANKKVNAYEAQAQAQGADRANIGAALTPDELRDYKAGQVALEALTKARSDYDYAKSQGLSLAAYKAIEVTKAETEALNAQTPSAKAAAESDLARANQIGSIIPKQERYRQLNEASAKTMREYQASSDQASRVQNQATESANQYADAATNSRKSLLLLNAEQKVAAEIAGKNVDPLEREKKVREELENQVAMAAKGASDRVRGTKEETDARETLTKKMQNEGMQAAEAQRLQSSYTEVMRLQREAMAVQGPERERLLDLARQQTEATKAQMSAEDEQKVAGMSQDEDRKIAYLRSEIELRSQDVETRNRQLAVMQAQQDLQKQGISTTAPESVAYLNKVAMRSDLDTAKQQYEKLAQEISGVVSGIFDDIFSRAADGSRNLVDNITRSISRLGSRFVEQNLISPLLGGQGGSSLLGSGSLDLGKVFNGSGIEEAVKQGSESGILGGLKPLLTPRTGANGQSSGLLSSPLGSGLLTAAVGGSIGYQTQSPLLGAAGGAASGFAMGGPVGAVVGAGAGLLGGLFGDSEADEARKKQKEEREKQRKLAYIQAKPQIDELIRKYQGEAVSGVEATVRATQAETTNAVRLAAQAGDMKKAGELKRAARDFANRLRGQFTDDFAGALRDLDAGQGLDGPFNRAAAGMRQLGEALKSFVADAAAQGRRVPALRAARAAALDQLDAPKELSATQERLRAIAGTASGLKTVLVDLGLSAKEAAEQIAKRTKAAIDAEKKTFSQSLAAKTNDALGLGYRNDLTDLVKERTGLLADSKALGLSRTQVDRYFAAAAQKIVDEAGLTGKAFDALVKRFPLLKGRVHEFTTSLEDMAARLRDAVANAAKDIQTYLDGITGGSNSTLAPQDRLAAAQGQFDRQLGLARAGNTDALGSITQYAEALRSAARDNYASGTQYQQIEKSITDALGALPNSLDSSIGIIKAIKDASDVNVSSLAALLSGVQTGSSDQVAATGLTTAQAALTATYTAGTKNSVDGNLDVTKQVSISTASTDRNTALSTRNLLKLDAVVATLKLINGQYGLPRPVYLGAGTNRLRLTNTIIGALNKIVYNTWQTIRAIKSNSGNGFKQNGVYAEGGYTGPGSKYDPAGVVHRGEIVWSQRDIARAGGVAAVEALRLGANDNLRGLSDRSNVVPIPVPSPMRMPVVPSMAAGGNADVVAELKALRAEVAGLRRENGVLLQQVARVDAAGHRMVGEAVDELRQETRRGNNDAKAAQSKPQRKAA